jgi:hypothetical protein
MLWILGMRGEGGIELESLVALVMMVLMLHTPRYTLIAVQSLSPTDNNRPYPP